MKRNIAILFGMLCIIIQSCSPYVQTQSIIHPTPTPRPRPLLEYDMGAWHSEIAQEMMRKSSIILDNSGESGIDFEIQILPAKSLQDEIIIIKYDNLPESADLGQVWYWLYVSIEVESQRYKLDPQSVITAEFKTEPYGEFLIENNNLIGFCEIPWNAVKDYTASGGQDVSDVAQFLDSWDCSYR